MCEGGAAEAGVKLFSNRGSANLSAAFEDQWLESSFGQIEGCD
jgi:hypothetical protein